MWGFVINFRCPQIYESVSCPKCAGESKRGAGSLHVELDANVLGSSRLDSFSSVSPTRVMGEHGRRSVPS